MTKSDGIVSSKGSRYRLASGRPLAMHLAMAATVLFGLAAQAKADQVAAPAAPAADTGAIEEVTVTAEKRTENVQDVPISIGVVTGQELQQQNIINIDDLGGKVANLTLELPFGPQEPQFSIRGVTETDYNQNQSSPIAMYVDGVFKSIGTLQSQQMFDVQRIEVERGPQGTFQGRNATGGAINIYTTPPDFDGLSGNVMAGVGNFGRYETQGAINIPIIDDQLAIRAAYTFTNVDGYFHNVAPDAPYSGNLSGVFDWGARLSALWKPIDTFSAILRVAATRSDPVNYGVYPLNVSPEGMGLTAGSLGPAVWGTTYIPSNTSAGNYVVVPNSSYHTTGFTNAGVGYFSNDAGTAQWPVDRRDSENRSASLEMNYDVWDGLKLTSVTGYDHGFWDTNEIDDGAPVNVDKAQYTNHVHSIQEDLRLASSYDGIYNFVLGGQYGYETLSDTVHNLFQHVPAGERGRPRRERERDTCAGRQRQAADRAGQYLRVVRRGLYRGQLVQPDALRSGGLSEQLDQDPGRSAADARLALYLGFGGRPELHGRVHVAGLADRAGSARSAGLRPSERRHARP